MPHAWRGGVIAPLARMRIASAIEPLELQFDETPHFFAIAGVALPRPYGGASAPPSGPGLGVALDFGDLPVRVL